MTSIPLLGQTFLAIRAWRIVQAPERNGLYMWFDPSLERPLLVKAPPDSESSQARSQSPPLGFMEHMWEGGVVPDEGSASEEIPEGVQKLNELVVGSDQLNLLE